MNTAIYNCPCCGAPLAYSGTSGKLECASCGNAFDSESMDAMSVQESDISFAMPQETLSGQDVCGYTCKSCGAELITDATTTATECPYCGSPTVLPAQIDGGVKPETVLPFKVTKEQATAAFNGYFKGKKLMPNIFLTSKNRIAEMRKLYVPYWLFDCDADADMVFDMEKVHTQRQGDWEIKTTEHYMGRRSGHMSFNSIPVDGSAKLDDRIGESLEPYDLSDAVPFQPAVLAGSMADHADVEAEVCQKRAVERVKSSVETAMRDTVRGYSRVTVRKQSIRTKDGKVSSALMPVWLITTDKVENGKNKTYTFAINGQSGKLTCDVRPDTRKSFVWGAGIFAGIMLIALLVMYLMESLTGGAAAIAAIAALIAALITVSILRGQLKTASLQAGASSYIREGSFHLRVNRDYFLYKNVERRKIQQQPKQSGGK